MSGAPRGTAQEQPAAFFSVGLPGKLGALTSDILLPVPSSIFIITRPSFHQCYKNYFDCVDMHWVATGVEFDGGLNQAEPGAAVFSPGISASVGFPRKLAL